MGMEVRIVSFLNFPWAVCTPHLTHLAFRKKRGQVGWGFEQPGLVEDVPAHGRGGGTR